MYVLLYEHFHYIPYSKFLESFISVGKGELRDMLAKTSQEKEVV